MAEQTKHNSVYKISDKEVDFKNAFPLTIGDWEALEKLKIVDGGSLIIKSTSQSIDLMNYIAHKANTDITRDDIRTIPINKLAEISDLIQSLMEESEAEVIKGADPT